MGGETAVNGTNVVRLRRHPSQESTTSSSTDATNLTHLGGRKLSFAQRRQLDEHKGPNERVVHRPQDSLFSTSSGWTNYRGFFNLAMLLLVVSNGRVALENVIKYGILISPIQWIEYFIYHELTLWNWPNTMLILLSSITLTITFLTEKLLEKGWIGNYTAGVFYPILISVHLLCPAVVTLRRTGGNPLFSVMSLGVYVMEALKLVSYVQVNYWARYARAERKEAESTSGNGAVETIKKKLSNAGISNEYLSNSSMYEMSALYPGTLTMKNMAYFMLAPTLCYELKFPVSIRRRKTFLVKRLGELIFLSFLIMALIQQWIIPTVQNSMAPLSEMEVGRCIERLLKLAIPNIFIWLIFFYTFFHSGLNFLAEVLRFADREFYRDFWNSETIQYFWKTWNIPVHRWALRHVYLPMMRNNYSKFSAMIVVFFISAFFHEYLVSVPLQMFRLWAYYGMMAQIPLSLITDYVVKGGRAGNVIVWLSLILGQPLAILMYVHDWYVLHSPESLNLNATSSA